MAKPNQHDDDPEDSGTGTRRDHVTVFLSGDVMTGRGIDQILPHPNAAELQESSVRDARDYVELAEQVNGPIVRPVDFRYIWGDALAELDRARLTLASSTWRRASHPAIRPGPGKASTTDCIRAMCPA
jgi:hypothetical protein